MSRPPSASDCLRMPRPPGPLLAPGERAILGSFWPALWLYAASLFACLAAAEPPPVERGSAEPSAAVLSWDFTPDPRLPDVLILGDSISIGYTLPVRASLTGIANVFRPCNATTQKPVNCGDTARGLEQLDAWLGNRTWRVIHFNFGLHDLKYLDERKQYVTPDKGRQVSPPPVYERNLERIVERLKRIGATLIWASTTPVPDGSPGRVQGDEVPFNAVARKVMAANGIAIDDLCGVISERISAWQKPHNVHFTDEGSRILARAVAGSIRQALGRP